MKKIFRNSMLVVMGLLFFACEAEENTQVYSCNESVNEWAKQNLSDIRNIKRSDWNKLDEAHKNAAYVAFTQGQRVLLWKGKIEQVLSLGWSENETNHIKELQNFIDQNPVYLQGKRLTEQQANQLDLFAYKWMTKAENDFGWDKKLIYAIIASANNLIDKDGNIEIHTHQKRVLRSGESGSTSDCNCNQTYDFCLTNHCEDSKCEEASIGCGWILAYACNGLCGGI